MSWSSPNRTDVCARKLSHLPPYIHTRNSLKELPHVIAERESPKSIGQAGRLEVQVRVDSAVLSPDCAGQQVRNSGKVPTLQSGGEFPSALGNLSLCP